LLADEPTGSLDFRTGEMIMGLIADLHRSREASGQPLTSIHVTHNLQFAGRADRIVRLEQGKLMETASLSDGSSRDDPSENVLGQGRNYV